MVVARRHGGVPLPGKNSLNWFIPAPVKSSVGSFSGTREALGRRTCPRGSKNASQAARS